MDDIRKKLLLDMDMFEEMFKAREARESRSESAEAPSIQLNDISNYKLIYGDGDSMFIERGNLPNSKI